ncbi:GntR family transcriptional regulator [Acrocarpospora catenulata]|uniref:GntR family transcriptional regulator n=1 Tax=Acrocarpospora catenulata TaxID=2836182 RepID=UPI001BD974DD|nr:winged helix-turn-helix domain-containing protein [Acrocarpospora catenulata]
MIEWRGNVPKSDQIADAIRARIADGTYEPDKRVPSEHELVTEFDVARGTARKALEKLRATGDIYSVRGLGHFVSPPGQLAQ